MAWFEIVDRAYGKECIFHHRDAIGDVNGSFIVADGDDVEAMIATHVTAARVLDAEDNYPQEVSRPSILTFEEQAKEGLKREIIAAMRASETMAACIGRLSWDRAALAQLLIYRYAVNARDQLGAELADESPASCWSLLASIACSMNDDQINEIL